MEDTNRRRTITSLWPSAADVKGWEASFLAPSFTRPDCPTTSPSRTEHLDRFDNMVKLAGLAVGNGQCYFLKRGDQNVLQSSMTHRECMLISKL